MISVRHLVVTGVRVTSATCIISTMAIATANCQTNSGTKVARDFVVGMYAGEERAFRNEDGELTGPVSYVFHLLAKGRGFVDGTNHRTGKSSRTFGVYTVASNGKGIIVQAYFFPSMDSWAAEPPATDFFSTFKFRFSNGKVTGKYMEDANSPIFPVTRIVTRKK